MVVSKSFSAEQKFNEYSYFSKVQSISDRFINGIVQDKDGFLWLATWDGLFRFDGYTSKAYKTNENDPEGLKSNGIRLIKSNSKGELWINCGNEIFYYNSALDEIQSFFNANKHQFYIENFLIDASGNMWILANNAVYRFKIEGYSDEKFLEKAKKYFYKPQEPNGIGKCNSKLMNLFEDRRSNIWISHGDNRIDKYIPGKDQFEHLLLNNIKGINQDSKYISGINFEDNNGNFWLTSFGAGVVCWNPKTNECKQYLNEPGKNSISSNISWSIIQDVDNQFWIGTDGGGISIFDQKSGFFKNYKKEHSNPNSFGTDAVRICFQDRSGIIWLGTQKIGLNKYERNKNKFGSHVASICDPDGLGNGPVNALLEDKEGNLWIGLDGGGLDFYDSKTGQYSHFFHEPNNPNSLGSNAIVCLSEDKNDNIWIGTYSGGLTCFNKKVKKMTRFVHDRNKSNSISHDNIFAVYADSKNNVWVGTMEGILNLYHPETNSFTQYKRENNNPNSFYDSYMTCIFEDSRHYLWIVTNNGLNYLKLNECDFSTTTPKLKFYHVIRKGTKNDLIANSFTVLNEDHEGNLWVGTDSYGLTKIDMKTWEITDLQEKDGLTSNSVKGILEDNEYNLWISTLDGLSKINTQKNSIKNYSKHDGIQDNIFARAYCKTKDGQLLFGGVNGYNAFYPNEIIENKIPPKIVLTDFRIFNKSVKIGQEIGNTILLKHTLSSTSKVEIPSSLNMFSIEFAALDFTIPEKNLYKFKLEGFDTEWQATNASNRTATYTNLNPGKYIFRVIASNNDEVWNEEGISLQIIILPPWWKTYWFKLIVVFTVLFLFYLSVYQIIKKVRQSANQTILNERFQLKVLINNIPDQVFIKDKKLRFVVVNEAALCFMNVKSESDIIGKSEAQFLSLEESEKLFLQESEILETGKTIINEESSKTIQGKEYVYLTTKSPIINFKSEIIGIVTIIRDITVQKQAEFQILQQSEELKKYNAELFEKNTVLLENQQQIEEQSEELRASNEKLSYLNATKDKLFSIIAHDLRNPFNGIIGFSDIMIKNFDKLGKEKILKYLELIYRSSKAANILLENLLQWSQVQTGRIYVELHKVNLFALVEHSINLLQSDAQRKNIEIDHSLEIDLNVIADENMLFTIFRNLISNAVKFTPEGGKIQITAVRKENYVEISVIDNGVGILEENISRLFNIEKTVSTLGTANEKGTGLGLLLCKEFIEKQNGKIWVVSIPEKGSKFIFSLQPA